MESVFENLKDTCEGKIAAEIEKLYAELEKQQSDWYKKTDITKQLLLMEKTLM